MRLIHSPLLKGTRHGLLILACLAFASGCQPQADANNSANNSADNSTTKQPAAPAAPQISVATVISQTVNNWHEFTGRLEAPEIVLLRPRVSGYIAQVNFKEGHLVKAGEVLLVIEPTPFEIALRHAEAALAEAQSQVTLATSELIRGRQLRRQNALSQQALDSRIATEQQSQALVQMRTAALDDAKLQLSYCQVKSPINGRISRAQMTQGNYVSAGESLLTSVVSTDKVYAYFDADEQTYLDFRTLQQLNHNPLTPNTANPPVFMGLINEQGYPHLGSIDFIDNHINAQTGTVRARAVFDNSQGTFTPGLFSRLKLIDTRHQKAILIDDKAVGTDLTNRFVFLLTGDNKVVYQPVTLGKKVNGLRLITAGLNGGDAIVVDGLQRVYSGSVISPDFVAMAADDVLAQLQAEQARVNEYTALIGSQSDTKPLATLATATEVKDAL